MRRIMLIILASGLLAACGQQSKSSCISAKDVQQHLGSSGCFYGTAETHGPPIAGFSVVSLREGPLDVLVDGAIRDGLNGQCIEVRGKVDGNAEGGSRMTLYAGPESNLRRCGE